MLLDKAYINIYIIFPNDIHIPIIMRGGGSHANLWNRQIIITYAQKVASSK